MSVKVANLSTSRADLRMPWRGCWELRATVFGAAAPSGRVSIDWRGWTLTGTVDAERSGVFQGAIEVVVVGGLGWSRIVTPRHWNADQGLKVGTLAADLARQAGETITVPASAERPLGRYFVFNREAGGTALSRLIGRSYWWWVRVDGMTQVGTRERATLGQGVSILDYDPSDGEAKLYAPRPDAVPVGAVLTSDRLPGGRRVVRELIVVADGKGERIRAHTEAA